MADFEISEIEKDICCLLDELGAKYKIHGKDDNEYSYLEENELSIRIPNPYVSHAIFINLQSKISLFFANWHAHYCYDETDYAEFCETLAAILNNTLCSASVFLGEGEECKWNCGVLAEKSDVENKPPEEAFAGNRIMAQVYSEQWEKNGATVRFVFCDPQYNKIVTIERKV